MNHAASNRGLAAAIALLLWSAVVLSVFYIIAHPLFPQVIRPVGATIWSITLPVLMLTVAIGMGSWTLDRMALAVNPGERLVLGAGLGLGILGFAGFGLAASGAAHPPVMLFLLGSLVFWMVLSGRWHRLRGDLKTQARTWAGSLEDVPAWIPVAVLAVVGMAFLFALLPPAEGFDGLLYHLALPERWLADQRILPYNVTQFWFPSLIEGDFLWGLGLGSERAAQLIHWSFLVLTLGMMWEWSKQVFGGRAAWWALLIVASMPSLPWLASWAYTDMALVFVNLACLYSVWRGYETDRRPWLVVGGAFAGMAMGIKYTSFFLPLLCLVLILAWEKAYPERLVSIIRFGAPALVAASPWYIRNWLVMGNPVYPFLFNGAYWDSFQSTWYAGGGTGIGWNLREMLALPFELMTGIHDQNYFDGRMGPLYLLLLPLAAWGLWRMRRGTQRERRTLLILWIFSGLSLAIWTLGIIQTMHLRQARLLWPGLIPFAIPIGVGLAHLTEWDLPRLRTSFIVTALIALVTATTLIDNGLSLAFRRPLSYSLGLETRQAYFERLQPKYAAALALVDSTPPDSYVYFMFEPRSYGMSRRVFPDPINNNLLHEFHLMETAEGVLNTWEKAGYTHVLFYDPGLEPAFKDTFQQLLAHLHLEGESEGYQLYSIQY